MYALVWINFEDRLVRAVSVSEDLDALKRDAFEIEKELATQGAEDDDEEPDWDVSDWSEEKPDVPGEITRWTWAPEWFQDGNGYQINLVGEV